MEPFAQRIADAEFIVYDQKFPLSTHYSPLRRRPCASQFSRTSIHDRTCVQREHDRKGGSFTNLRLHGDRSSMALDNAAADRQAQANSMTTFFCSQERLKNL